MKPANRLPRIALVWTQFASHHVDRCSALAERLDGKAQVLAIEVATTSREYPDFGSASGSGTAQRLTLFPGHSFDELPRWRRTLAVLRSVAGCRAVCLGVPYSELDFLLLSLVLRLLGVRVILLSVSKFDDSQRSAGFEFFKRLALSCFSAVVVPGVRGRDFYRFLGFRRRPVVVGGNTISIARVRKAAGSDGMPAPTPFAQRDFIYVGRFIAKKNLSLLIEAYARYCELEGKAARRLVLVGSGPMEAQLRREAAEKVGEDRVIFTGFLAGAALYDALARSLALVLVSTSEQWGLVVNEALALGLPVLASDAPGARDVLVRNLVNGFVVENDSAEGIARAMQQLGADEAAWQTMCEASGRRAQLGDVAVFAEAVAAIAGFEAEAENPLMSQYRIALDEFRGPAAQDIHARRWRPN